MLLTSHKWRWVPPSNAGECPHQLKKYVIKLWWTRQILLPKNWSESSPHPICLTNWPLGNVEIISKLELQTRFMNWYLQHFLWNCSQENATEPFDYKSALVQVMAWCHQATSHYLSQCWPRSCRHMTSLGHNELRKGNGQWSDYTSGNKSCHGFVKPAQNVSEIFKMKSISCLLEAQNLTDTELFLNQC